MSRRLHFDYEADIVAWKAYYDIRGDITEFEGDGTVGLFELPQDKCIAIVVYYSDGAAQDLMGYDYYFFVKDNDDVIFGCDIETREKEIVSDINKRYDNPYLIRGIWTTRAKYRHILDEIIKLRDSYSASRRTR